MKLKRYYMKNSLCYQKAPRVKKFVGIVVHDTGAGNPYIKRYVQPSDDDPEAPFILSDLGANENGNDWNHKKIEKGAHAFIGRNRFDEVETVEVMPYDRAAWGVGNGKIGSYNYDPTARIQFEICDDGYLSETYFETAMHEAMEYCAYLCEKFGFDPERDICSHHEAYKAGFGCDHGDIDKWLGIFCRDMDWFRAGVKRIMREAKPFAVYNANGELVARCTTEEEAGRYSGCRVVDETEKPEEEKPVSIWDVEPDESEDDKILAGIFEDEDEEGIKPSLWELLVKIVKAIIGIFKEESLK